MGQSDHASFALMPPPFARRLVRRCVFALAAMGGIRPSAATAQAGAPPREALTGGNVRSLLRDDAALLAWVRARSPEVAASSARVAQAQADLGQSRVVPNPIVDFGVS